MNRQMTTEVLKELSKLGSLLVVNKAMDTELSKQYLPDPPEVIIIAEHCDDQPIQFNQTIGKQS